MTTSIIVLAKNPAVGEVKTRLAPALGMNGACRFYRALLVRTLDVLANYPAARRIWCYSGPLDAEIFAHLDRRILCAPQKGEGLGPRMHDALDEALKHTEKAILIGADCPELNAAYLAQAEAVLAAGSDLVFGPSHDGGYVLVGVQRTCPDIFSGITYSRPDVLRESVLRVAALRRPSGAGYSSALLPALNDIDEPCDLRAWASRAPAEFAEFMRGAGLTNADGTPSR